MGIGKIGTLANNFSHQRDPSLRLLLGQYNECQMIFCLQVIWIYSQLTLKLTSSILELPCFEMNQARVKMGQSNFVVQRERRLQLFERFHNVATFVMRLAKQNV